MANAIPCSTSDRRDEELAPAPPSNNRSGSGRADINAHVDSVGKGSREFRLITRNGDTEDTRNLIAVPEISAWTRIARHQQLEMSREHIRAIRTNDADRLALKWLT